MTSDSNGCGDVDAWDVYKLVFSKSFTIFTRNFTI